jgi:hypothetical protein
LEAAYATPPPKPLTPAPDEVLLGAGVVEGDVEAPECVDGLLERRLHVLRTGHVTPDGDRAPAGLLDQAGRFLVGFLREVGDDHAGARARKRQRRGTADAARRTRHECRLARKAPLLIHRNHPLLVSSLAVTVVGAP